MVVPALLERIIFYSVDRSPYQSEARFEIVSSQTQFDPTISSITTSIIFELPFFEGSGTPNHSESALPAKQPLNPACMSLFRS